MYSEKVKANAQRVQRVPPSRLFDCVVELRNCTLKLILRQRLRIGMCLSQRLQNINDPISAFGCVYLNVGTCLSQRWHVSISTFAKHKRSHVSISAFARENVGLHVSISAFARENVGLHVSILAFARDNDGLHVSISAFARENAGLHVSISGLRFTTTTAHTLHSSWCSGCVNCVQCCHAAKCCLLPNVASDLRCLCLCCNEYIVGLVGGD